MRAVTYDEFGEVGVLHLGEVEEPHAGEGEVRIRVAAAGVNPLDWKIRSGAGASFVGPEWPKVPGYDASGAVDEVGPGVDGVAVGDLVYGAGSGVTAEHAVLHHWAPVPDGLDVVTAAGLPTPTETAARVLGLLPLAPGDVLVVDGAAGGVGSALVQIAASRGLSVVGTASEANHDYLRDLGALPTTYGAGLADRVRTLIDQPVTGAADLVGHGGVPALVELTGDAAKVVSIADFDAAEQGVQVTGTSERYDAWAGEINPLIAAGRFRVEVAAVVPWTDAARAHELSETGHVRGKVLIEVS